MHHRDMHGHRPHGAMCLTLRPTDARGWVAMWQPGRRRSPARWPGEGRGTSTGHLPSAPGTVCCSTGSNRSSTWGCSSKTSSTRKCTVPRSRPDSHLSRFRSANLKEFERDAASLTLERIYVDHLVLWLRVRCVGLVHRLPVFLCLLGSPGLHILLNVLHGCSSS